MNVFNLLLFCVASVTPKFVTDDDLPESFDWRDHGAVLPPSSVGVFCGSSDWAFSIVSAIESQLFLANGTLESLSPQYVLDCCSFSDGCNAGPSLETAYACLERNGGVSSHYSYFNGMQGACFGGANLPITYKSWSRLSEEELLELLVKRGPLNVIIDGTNLSSYTNGIWNASNCIEGTNKTPWAVNVVGYGSDIGTDYWIIKNWRGDSWGEQGYFRLARNQNACGITDRAFVPIVLI